MVLWELYLFLSLREDEGNISGHKKSIRELLEQEKSIAVPNITVL
jgi:hypothetical protein